MRTSAGWTVLALLLGWALLWAPTIAGAQLDDAGVGFVLRSTDFAQPCTPGVGDIPNVYDNATKRSVEVSVKVVNTVVNTGQKNLFVKQFVTPPPGPTQRPRIMRFTVGPAQGLGIKAQGEPCGWIAVIQAH